MGTIFAQKLLHDLRLRKERMAAVYVAQNSDAPRNSGKIIEGCGEKSTSAREIGSTIGSTYKNHITSRKSLVTIKATSEKVLHGSSHQLRQAKDVSKAIAYVFDGGGKIKSVDFSTLIGFLQQSPNMQLQSTNQFPNLTHLDINELAQRAKKLSQILRAHSLGLHIDKGSTETEKELWKGAMELEQSLKMLVNLPEPSEKLMEDSEDSEDGSPIITEKPKQVERPLFSFDKALKNEKGVTENGTKQKPGVTYLNEAPNFEPEKQVPITSKGNSRDSTVGDSEFQSKNSSKFKHSTGKLPNVIAKLMGLEELAKDISKKIATEHQTTSKQRSGAVVSTKKAYRSQLSADIKTKYVKNVELKCIQNGIQSNKITVFKSHQPEPPKETYRVTYNYSCGSTADPLDPKWSKKDREAINNHLLKSQEAIIKINELQSRITQIKHNNTGPDYMKSEIEVTRQKEQAMDDTETLQTTVLATNQSSQVVNGNQVRELKNCRTDETEVVKKPLLKEKQKRESQMQQPMVLSGHETHRKMLKPEVRSQKRANKSELEIPERKARLKKLQNVSADVNKLLKQPPMTQPHAGKENTAKANALPTSEALEGNVRNEVCAKVAYASATKVFGDINPPKNDSKATKSGVITQYVKTTTNTAKALNTNQPILQNSVQRNSISGGSRGNSSIPKPKQNIPEIVKRSTQAFQHDVDAEQKITNDVTVRHESHCKEIVFSLPTNDENQDTKTAAVFVDQHCQQIHPDEIQEAKSKRTATDGCNYSRNIFYDLQQMQPRPARIAKQDRLTEDEMYLKQKIMMSNIFLNTAEALFKLNIPISVLNYVNNQNFQDEDSNLIVDCGCEVLKRKGRNQEVFLYPLINSKTMHQKVKSLDDLVRQLHKDFEILRTYGGDEYDYAESALKMLEKDIHYNNPDLNCTWDLGWKDTMFAYIEMDEKIRDVEQEVLEELLDEMVNDFMLSS